MQWFHHRKVFIYLFFPASTIHSCLFFLVSGSEKRWCCLLNPEQSWCLHRFSSWICIYQLKSFACRSRSSWICLSFCTCFSQCVSIKHVNNSSVWLWSSFPVLILLFFLTITGNWRIRCRCFDSSSAQPSASLTSTFPLWNCLLMSWGPSTFYSPAQIWRSFLISIAALKAVRTWRCSSVSAFSNRIACSKCCWKTMSF